MLISIREVKKYADENDLVIDMLLTQYQQNEHRKMRQQLEINENKQPSRKPTKRKATTAITEFHNTTKE